MNFLELLGKYKKTFFNLCHLFPCQFSWQLVTSWKGPYLCVHGLSPGFGSGLWKPLVPVLHPHFQSHLWPFSFCCRLCCVGWLTLAAPCHTEGNVGFGGGFRASLRGIVWRFTVSIRVMWCSIYHGCCSCKTTLEAFRFSSLGTPGSCFYVLLLSAWILFHSFHITWDSRWECAAR